VIVRQSFSGTGLTDVARRLLNILELLFSDDRADNIAVTMVVSREGRKRKEEANKLIFKVQLSNFAEMILFFSSSAQVTCAETPSVQLRHGFSVQKLPAMGRKLFLVTE
jgi:hypothetical protein